ncbi:MAG: hypothetical protein AAFS13_08475 [Pseudomonadota bacterium]
MLRFLRKISLLASVGVGLTLPAFAQLPGSSPADDRFYIAGFVGGAFPGDADFEGVQAPDPGSPGAAGDPANVEIEFDNDIFFGGAIGYQLPFQFFEVIHPRIELEVSYFEADVEAGAFNGGDQIFGGDQSTLFVFFNQYGDFKFRDNQLLIPYFGGGIGIGIIDSNVLYFPNNGVATEPTFGVLGEDTGFAGHTAIGLTFKATDALEVYGEGRYYNIFGVDLERRFVGGGADIFNADVDDRLDGFNVTAGMRFRF